MRDAQPRTIRLKDYRVPDFLIDTTELHFELHEDHTLVRARLEMRRNPASDNQLRRCELDGQNLLLRSVSIEGSMLTPDDYGSSPDQLIDRESAGAFCLSNAKPKSSRRRIPRSKVCTNRTRCSARSARRKAFARLLIFSTAPM